MKLVLRDDEFGPFDRVFFHRLTRLCLQYDVTAESLTAVGVTDQAMGVEGKPLDVARFLHAWLLEVL